MDIIGKIHPPFSREYNYILVTTYYFIKLVEPFLIVRSTKKLWSRLLRKKSFINLDYQKQTLLNQQLIFMGRMWNNSHKSKKQAKSTNKKLILKIQKLVKHNHKVWHDTFLKVLWHVGIYRIFP